MTHSITLIIKQDLYWNIFAIRGHEWSKIWWYISWSALNTRSYVNCHVTDVLTKCGSQLYAAWLEPVWPGGPAPPPHMAPGQGSSEAGVFWSPVFIYYSMIHM